MLLIDKNQNIQANIVLIFIVVQNYLKYLKLYIIFSFPITWINKEIGKKH